LVSFLGRFYITDYSIFIRLTNPRQESKAKKFLVHFLSLLSFESRFALLIDFLDIGQVRGRERCTRYAEHSVAEEIMSQPFGFGTMATAAIRARFRSYSPTAVVLRFLVV
jgi:hypothetical protein